MGPVDRTDVVVQIKGFPPSRHRETVLEEVGRGGVRTSRAGEEGLQLRLVGKGKSEPETLLT